VISVGSGKDREGDNVECLAKDFKLSQKWSVVYVNEAEKSKTKGMYKPFGIYLSRPFYIRSKMPMQRVLEVVNGRNLIIKTMDRTKEQQIFFLDPKSHTIKSVMHKEASIDIQNSG